MDVVIYIIPLDLKSLHALASGLRVLESQIRSNMNNQTCGYQGHYCSSSDVQFISRYRDENDYCVGGKRVTVYDDGRTRTTCDVVTESDKAAILAFERAKYAEYLTWHDAQVASSPHWPIKPEPFSFVIA